MEQPWTHYFDVTVSVTGVRREQLIFVMPVWTPGSYLVREFARNVEAFSACDGSGNALDWTKVDKSTWIVHSKGALQVVTRYRVYAFESSVRTSFLDDSHGFINGAGLFMYLDGYLHVPYRVKITPYAGWSRISTGLDPVPGTRGVFHARDFDTLVDCPFEIGTHTILEFECRGIPHHVALYGEGNYEPGRLRTDLQKIVEEAAGIIGEIPYEHYTLLIQLLAEGGGGLEHANSASVIVSRWAFKPEDSYRNVLSLVSHEVFHAWNGKRIRPKELGPFDYTRENYTRLLWVSEGFTDYYGDLILRRAGLATPDQYLEQISKSIQEYEETPGRLAESPADASFDAWIKFYRKDANSLNASVSYYLKGALIGLVLDLEIRHHSDCSRNLDDVMRLLYSRYYKKLKRGFTEAEFRDACEEVAHAPLERIFADYAYGTKEIDFPRYLGHAGLELVQSGNGKKEAHKAYLGVHVRNVEGKAVITAIPKGSPAYGQGLNVNDEIIALDGYRADTDTLPARLEEKAPDAKVDIIVSRAGKLRNISVVLGRKQAPEYRIVKTKDPVPEQVRLYESWLRNPWN